MKVKNIVKTVIKTLFIETGYGLAISLFSLFKRFLATIIAQGAASSEISRLEGNTPLVVSEALAHYNNSFNFVANAFIAMFIILGIYSIYKAVMKIIENTESNSENK